MNEPILNNDDPVTYREAIAQNGCILAFTRGTSMVPLIIEGRNYVALERLDTTPQVGDILLFEQMRKGKMVCVLHRLVGIQERNQSRVYVTRGDNCTGCEYVRREDIIGRVMAIYSVKGKRVKKPCGTMYMVLLRVWRLNDLRKWAARFYRLFTGKYFRRK